MSNNTATSNGGADNKGPSSAAAGGTTDNTAENTKPRVVDFSKINVSMLRSLQRTPTHTGTLRNLRPAPRVDGAAARGGGFARRAGRDRGDGAGRLRSSDRDVDEGSSPRRQQSRSRRGGGAGRGSGGREGGSGSRGLGGRAKKEDVWLLQWDDAERSWLAEQAEKRRGLPVRFDPQLTAEDLAGWAPAVPSFVVADGSEPLPLPFPSSSSSSVAAEARGEEDGKEGAKTESGDRKAQPSAAEKSATPPPLETHQQLAQQATFVRAQNERGGGTGMPDRYGQSSVVAYEPRIASHPARFIEAVKQGRKVFFQSEAERRYAERVVAYYLDRNVLKRPIVFGPETEALGELDELRGPILSKVLEGRYGDGPQFVEPAAPTAAGVALAAKDRRERILKTTLAMLRNYTTREPTWTKSKSSVLEDKVAELISGRPRSTTAEGKI